MRTVLPYDLPVPLSKAYFQRLLLAVSLFLMVILLYSITHEIQSFVGLLGTAYFVCSACVLAKSWHSEQIIAVKGTCVSCENSLGNMVTAVFSVHGIEESVLTLPISRKGIKVVPSLEYTLYIRKDNHAVLYGIENSVSGT